MTKAALVKWEDAVEVVGHLMTEQPEYRCERYLVQKSPGERDMIELRKRALSFEDVER